MDNEHNKAFYQAWVKYAQEGKVPTILVVYYSRPEEIWDELKQSDMERFAKYTNNQEAKFVVADKNMTVFKEQIKAADTIYFRGGKPQMIVDIMGTMKDEFKDLIKGKVYAGSSAGVMFLSAWSRSRSRDWMEWLGLLPINTIVHYSDEVHKESLEEFKKEHLDNKNEYILLPETEFIVKEY